MQGNDEHQHAQTKPAEANPNTPPGLAPRIDKESAENAENYAYYKAHPKEYLKAAIAPANLCNWILAGLAAIAAGIGLVTLFAVKKQADHIANSERAWIVATMKIKRGNPRIPQETGESVIYAESVLTNEGKTPAFILEAGMGIWVETEDDLFPDVPPPYDPRYTMKWEANGISISPGMSIVRQVFKETENTMSIWNGESWLYVYGYVKYRDVFSTRWLLRRKIRETRFCFRYIPEAPQFGMAAQFLIEGHRAYNCAT